MTIPKSEVPSSDPHRGFGYVEYEIPADAQEAIDNMDQSELFGKVIKVAQAKPQKDSNEGLGSKQAIWTQVRLVCYRSIAPEAYLKCRKVILQNMAVKTMRKQSRFKQLSRKIQRKIQCRV